MRNDHRVTLEALQGGHALTLSIVGYNFVANSAGIIIFVRYSRCCLASCAKFRENSSSSSGSSIDRNRKCVMQLPISH